MTPADLIIKPYRVEVSGYGSGLYYAASRGKALADAWRCDAFNNMSFGAFLRIARACEEEPHARFGEELVIGGRRAYLVSWNGQYIRFAWPGSTEIHNSHPLDVDPPEARRGTPYYQPSLGGGAR